MVLTRHQNFTLAAPACRTARHCCRGRPLSSCCHLTRCNDTAAPAGHAGHCPAAPELSFAAPGSKARRASGSAKWHWHRSGDFQAPVAPDEHRPRQRKGATTAAPGSWLHHASPCLDFSLSLSPHSSFLAVGAALRVTPAPHRQTPHSSNSLSHPHIILILSLLPTLPLIRTPGAPCGSPACGACGAVRVWVWVSPGAGVVSGAWRSGSVGASWSG